MRQGHRLLFSDDADAPEWVTYQYSIPPCPTGLETGLELLHSSVGKNTRSRLYELNHWMWRYGVTVKLSRGVERD
jgi:hypothetical protein